MAPIRASWQDLLKMRVKDTPTRSVASLVTTTSIARKDTPTQSAASMVATTSNPTNLPTLHESRQAPSEVLTSHGTNHKVFTELRGTRSDAAFQTQSCSTSSAGRTLPPTTAQKPANADHSSPVLNLHWLLKTANPLWTPAEFKAAKRKLKLIGIESYSDMQESLQGKGVLNNRLREQGLKAFAPATLERLRSTINSEQERQRQAAILQLQRALRHDKHLDLDGKHSLGKETDTRSCVQRDLDLDAADRTRSAQQWYCRQAMYLQKKSVKEIVSHGHEKCGQDTWYDTDSTGDEGPGYSSVGSSAPESPSGVRTTSCVTVFSIGTP